MIQQAHLRTSFADVVALSCNYPGHVVIPDQIDTYCYDLHLCAFESLGYLPIPKRPKQMGQSVAPMLVSESRLCKEHEKLRLQFPRSRTRSYKCRADVGKSPSKYRKR
jgi:hypothetical protein